MKKIYFIALSLVLAFTLLSCSKKPLDEVENSPSDENTPEIENPIENENSDNKIISELTGLEIDKKLSNKRPIAVMINNNAASLPQSGISLADIIFECEAEGGETRMLALFSDYENMETIGTIRSSRDYFIDFAQIFDAIYIHAGGSPQAYEQLKSRKIENLDGVNMYLPNCFWRDPERRKKAALEHTLVTSGKKIATEVINLKYRTEHSKNYKPSLNFSDKEYVPGGENAEYIKIPRYIASEFNYDKEKAIYTHTEHKRIQSDAENNQNVEITNIIILFAEQNIVSGDEKNRISVDFTGSGNGYYISKGKYVPITWKRSGRDDGILLFDEEKQNLSLNKGKSYISVVSSAYSKKVIFK